MPDPYLWLEDIESAEVLEFVRRHNVAVEARLGGPSSRLLSRVKRFMSVRTLLDYVPTSRGIVGLVRDASFKVVMLDEGGEKVIADSREIGDDAVILAIDARKEGDRVAYFYSHGGSDVGKLTILDPLRLEVVDELSGTVGNVVWLDRESYYYVRFYRAERTPDGVGPPAERVFLRGAAKERMVFGEGLPTNHFITLKPSSGGDALLINVNYGWQRSWVMGGKLGQQGEWGKVYGGGDFIVQPVDYVKGYYYVISFEGRGTGRLLRVSGDSVEAVVDEHERYPIVDAAVTDDSIVINRLVDASSRLSLYEIDGRWIKDIGFGIPVTVSGLKVLNGRPYFKYESFTIPYALCSLEGFEVKVLSSSGVEGDFAVSERWARSYDGTPIHYFVVSKKGVRPEKVLLHGYGGFSISMTPRYLAGLIPLLMDGGAYAEANLRGGGEYGEAWHRAGIREKKPNVFEDYYAVIRRLRDEGAERVVALGRSNGGLLVAATIVRHPESVNGAVIGYPVIDMLRFHKLHIGQAWVPEYGNPEEEGDRAFLEAYSPYHNASRSKGYPPILIYTGLRDDRVHPAHAFKFAAKLEELGADVLLRVETAAGHGGAAVDIKAKEVADVLAFVYKALGIEP